MGRISINQFPLDNLISVGHISANMRVLIIISVIAFLNPNIFAATPLSSAKLLEEHVGFLVSLPKPRNFRNVDTLNSVANYISDEFKKSCATVSFQSYQVGKNDYKNVICSFGNNPKERFVVGAHYDVEGNQQGADDNASGVAGLLELARLIGSKGLKGPYQIDLVAYTLEEPPHYGTESMGSYVHAKSLSDAGVDVKLMLSLEMIGYFSDKENSQEYPLSAMKHIYGTIGNFIAVVGHTGEISLGKKIKELMREPGRIRVEGLNAPKIMTGIDFSDHRSYWQFDYPAFMITDTSFYRNSNYHKSTDTIDTLNFEKMAAVIDSVYNVLRAIP